MILKCGHLVETDRSGLVPNTGQTGPKTNKKIDGFLTASCSRRGHSLVAAANEDAYGQEAVQTLLKRMEDHRDWLVVVLAGYPEPWTICCGATRACRRDSIQRRVSRLPL
jgi:hypothetical protein